MLCGYPLLLGEDTQHQHQSQHPRAVLRHYHHDIIVSAVDGVQQQWIDVAQRRSLQTMIRADSSPYPHQLLVELTMKLIQQPQQHNK